MPPWRPYHHGCYRRVIGCRPPQTDTVTASNSQTDGDSKAQINADPPSHPTTNADTGSSPESVDSLQPVRIF